MMNERIKELVAQAESYAYEHEEHWHDGPDWQELFNEKFAELIVRECCQFEKSYGGDAGLVARSFSRKIKEHFGVEE